jgi:hypothetical protein
LEAVALGIATNLVSALMVAGSERLRVAALGDEKERALEGAFTGATAAMLVEAARRAGLDRELPGRIEERLGGFFGDRWVAEQLIGAARPDGLRRRYGELGFEPGELPMGFEEAMELFARELAARLREDARAGGSLANIVVVGDVEAMRGMLEGLASALKDADIPGEDVAAIGCTANMGGVRLLDQSGRDLRNGILWTDGRAAPSWRAAGLPGEHGRRDGVLFEGEPADDVERRVRMACAASSFSVEGYRLGPEDVVKTAGLGRKHVCIETTEDRWSSTTWW